MAQMRVFAVALGILSFASLLVAQEQSLSSDPPPPGEVDSVTEPVPEEKPLPSDAAVTNRLRHEFPYDKDMAARDEQR